MTNYTQDKSVVIIGLMGAGKSKVGRLLAPLLNIPFVDSDKEVEIAANCSLETLYTKYGEDEFRALETRVITRLVKGPPRVISTGGGALFEGTLLEHIQQNCITIWLRADINVLLERTLRRNNRPLLKSGNPEEILNKLMADCYPLYEKADLIVDSQDVPAEKIVGKIYAQVRKLQMDSQKLVYEG